MPLNPALCPVSMTLTFLVGLFLPCFFLRFTPSQPQILAGGDAPKLRHGQGGSRMLVSPGAPASRAVRGKHGRRALHRVLRAHVAALHHCSIQLPGGKRNIMDASRPRLLT
eukprot:363483-Chlamydomonas_euryale.AAC.3